MNIKLNPDVLRWARERSGLDESSLAKKVLGARGAASDVREWETTGELALRWVETIARKTNTAFGYLFLPVRCRNSSAPTTNGRIPLEFARIADGAMLSPR